MSGNHTEKVREFHEKHKFNCDESLLSPPQAMDRAEHLAASVSLYGTSQLLQMLSKRWENGTTSERISAAPDTFDLRLLRAHLIIEEVAEVLHALATRDEIELLDGLADLDYVTHGTALSYGLPLEAAFDEVHRSNMSKVVGAGGDKDVRCRKKGESFEPPDLKGVLRGRQKS